MVGNYGDADEIVPELTILVRTTLSLPTMTPQASRPVNSFPTIAINVRRQAIEAIRRFLGLAARPDVAVVIMEMVLIGPIDCCGCVVCGTVLYPLAIYIEVHQFARPIDFLR